VNDRQPGGDYDRALAYATAAHAGQLRKGTSTPYIVHPLGVAELVLKHGGSEVEAIAALLHDTVEDQGGRERLEDLQREFGERVAHIVEGCTEWIQEPGQTEADKPPWEERKRRAIEHIHAESDRSVLLVSLADKLHNARSIVADLRTHGPRMLDRFNRPDGVLWYYAELAQAYCGKGLAQLEAELERAVTEMRALADRPTG
jgi:(p)ppGpp synthase/HD superfamily hydrolase